MLKIREDQDQVFRDRAREDFIQRMLVHIEKHFPDHHKALDEEQRRELVETGIARAARHAVVNERDVCKFIDLMLIFGVEFDTDPAHPWAAEILGDPMRTDPSAKVDATFDAGLEELKQRPDYRA